MARSKKQIRNLAQYRDMSDEDFEEMWKSEYLDTEPSKEFEEKIKAKVNEFGDDYDLSDLKINDLASLRALVQAYLALEEYEQTSFKIRAEGVSQGNLHIIEKLNKVKSDLRADISKLQDDLNIKRKVRKSDKELSVINEIESLKLKARKFYEAKMQYIFCPKCNMLLGTIWTLYPTDESNKVTLTCNRKVDDKVCGEVVEVSTKKMLENRGSNKSELMPEAML